MSKYVLIPDSFKGTLSSADICRIAAEEILRLEPPAEVCAIPVADGGEGTVDAFLAAVGGRRIEAPCTGPWGEPVTAHYALLPDGTAVVEMAAAAGLPLAGDACDPEKTTTYGVGQLFNVQQSYWGGGATWMGGRGLLLIILGPIAVRLSYELMMMAVLLVKNVMEINRKLADQTGSAGADVFRTPDVQELKAAVQSHKADAPAAENTDTPEQEQ